jgi:stage II sporulation protein M
MKKRNKVKRLKKKQFSLKEEYLSCFEYIKQSRKFIELAVIIFLIFGVIGFFIPVPKIIYDQIVNFIKELLKQTEGMSQLELIKFIISNNFQSTFLLILLGIAFGIFPIIGAAINGYVLGFVSMVSVNSAGIFSLWKLLPHGIFEFPAIFLSLGLGIRLGTIFWKKESLENLKEYLLNSIKIFLLIILPLLLIAGIIEGSLMYLIN